VHFIERLLGVSPYGGDGSLERMVLVLLVMICVAIGMHLPYWRKNQKTTNGKDGIKTSELLVHFTVSPLRE
jgi:hypothetical protein